MDPVIFIELAPPEIRQRDGFANASKLLTEPHAHEDRRVLAFVDPSLRKHESLIGLFRRVAPVDGRLSLELCLELPEFLPDIEGYSESVVVVLDNEGNRRQLCLSNRIGRYRWLENGRTWHCLLPRDGPTHGEVVLEHPAGVRRHAVEQLMRSMASMTFEISGGSAEEAFETSIRRCLDLFFGCINRVQVAMRSAMKGARPSITPVSRDSVGYIYVLVHNAHHESESAVLTIKASRVVIRPGALEGSDAEAMRLTASGERTLSDLDLLLDQADASFNNGWYEFAFLQAVIAAELCAARVVQGLCRQRGVSKGKLDEQRDNMTYSWMLNVGLFLVLESSERPSEELVASMNAGRRRRNELMHEGVFDATRDEVRKHLRQTREFVDSLRPHLT